MYVMAALIAVQEHGAHQAGGSHTGAVALVAVLVAVVVAVAASVVSPRWRRKAPRALGLILGGLLAIYPVGRGIAEFWVVNYSDRARYRRAWGGPRLTGVFAEHSGPGLVILIATFVWLRKRRRTPRARQDPLELGDQSPPGTTPPSPAIASTRRGSDIRKVPPNVVLNTWSSAPHDAGYTVVYQPAALLPGPGGSGLSEGGDDYSDASDWMYPASTFWRAWKSASSWRRV